MHSQNYIAVACALLGAVAASPAQDGIATYTHIDYVTELVTSTVWVDASDPRANQTPAPVASVSKVQNDVTPDHSHSHGDVHGHGHASSSSSSVYTAPAPTPVVPVAQTTSSPVVIAPSVAAIPSSSIAVPPPPPPPATTLSTSVVAPAPAPEKPTTTTQPAVVATTPAVQTTATPPANNPAPPAASSSPAAATQGSGSGSGKHYTNARLTFYDPKGGYGSCGSILYSSSLTVALNAADMNALGKANVCGKSITISVNGHTADATIADTCPGCPEGGLDLTSFDDPDASDGVWKKLELDPHAGHVDTAEWWFN